MRQAGRSLPEYRALRGEGSILEAVAEPDLAVELTLQPVRRYGVDAAILFCDIMVPFAATGFAIDVRPGIGPVVDPPLRSEADLARLRQLEADEDVPYVTTAVEKLAATLGTQGIPLIGFAGAPFTVASYLIEGGPTRSFARTKALMHGDPQTWAHLMEKLADMSIVFLEAQVSAGATAVQLFDSWAGVLSPAEYSRDVLPSTTRILHAVRDLGVPSILFGVGTGELLALMGAAGPDVVGVDWRVPIDEARARVGPDHAVQGNLDPAICLAPWEVVAAEARDVLRRAGPATGHVFNLGHGVLPETDPGILAELVRLVHDEDGPGASR